MNIVKYRTELDENLHSILVKEEACNYGKEAIQTPEDIAEMLNSLFRLKYQAEEMVYMVALNVKMKPLGVFEISHGAACRSFCNPREIYIRALLCSAYGIVIAHNHTSMDVTPSKDDIETFQRMVQAGEILGVSCLDSLIVGDGYCSIREYIGM